MVGSRPVRSARPVLALLGVLLALLALTSCIDLRPHVLSDPAMFAIGPERHRGDGRDKRSIQHFSRAGADFGPRPYDAASDRAVANEALRIHPPSGGRESDLTRRDALTMILRRRPRAAYVALTERMAHPGADARAGAIWMFIELDARHMGRVEPDHVPPWSGPERDAALAKLEALLFSDPNASVRSSAAAAFERGIGAPARPTWNALLAALEREADPEVYDLLLRVLATRDAPAADRIEAAVVYPRDWHRVDDLLQGLVTAQHRQLLESAFRRGPSHFRQNVLRQAADLAPPQPWVEGLVLLAITDPEPHVRNAGAVLAGNLDTPSPAVLDRLRSLRGSNSYAAQTLKELESRSAAPGASAAR